MPWAVRLMIDRLDCPVSVNAASTREDSHKTITGGNIMTVRIIQATWEYFRNTCMTVRKLQPKPSTAPDHAPVTEAISEEQASLISIAAAIDYYSPARVACDEFLIISSMRGRADLPLRALFENYQHWTSKFGLPKLSKQAFADVLRALNCGAEQRDHRWKGRGCNGVAPRSRPKTSCNKQLSLPLDT